MSVEEHADYEMVLQMHAQLIDIPADDPVKVSNPATGDTGLDAGMAFTVQIKWERMENAYGASHPAPVDRDADMAFAMQMRWEEMENSHHVSHTSSGIFLPAFFGSEAALYRDYMAFMKREGHVRLRGGAASDDLVKNDDGGFPDLSSIAKNDCHYFENPPSAPMSNRFISLQHFMDDVRRAKCKNCKAEFFGSPSDIRAFCTALGRSRNLLLSSQITCTSCNTVACLFCPGEHEESMSKLTFAGQEITWCCDSGMVFLIWIILCGFDDRFTDEETPKLEDKRKKTEAAYAANSGAASSDRGIGYGGSWDSAWRSHLNSEGPHSRRRRKSSAAREIEQVQMEEDFFYGVRLRTLTGLLPDENRDTMFDSVPPLAVQDMLLESSILGYCASLLRNDSMMDVSGRRMVYIPLIDFVISMCSHKLTATLIHAKRPVRKDTHNLLKLSFENNPMPRNETASAVADSAHNLVMQGRRLLKSSDSQKKVFEHTDGKLLLSLAKRIDELGTKLDILDTHSMMNGNKEENVASVVEPVTYVPEDILMSTYAFAKDASELVTTRDGRMRRLLTEKSTLETGLPPGIFVRFGSARPDIMKVFIIGPEDTPYANGIFEFDVFCGESYPMTPPEVQFKTTSGGTVTFNPNLYEDGTVCLSLLGTWPGERWSPLQSTLLQLFVSLQAMIFCEEPWFNEPGREHDRGTAQSRKSSSDFNIAIRRLTVEHAILPVARDPADVCKDIANQHFTENSEKILRTVQKWLNTDSKRGLRLDDRDETFGFRDTKLLSDMCPGLQDIMHKKYGATFGLELPDDPYDYTRNPPPAPRVVLCSSPDPRSRDDSGGETDDETDTSEGLRSQTEDLPPGAEPGHLQNPFPVVGSPGSSSPFDQSATGTGGADVSSLLSLLSSTRGGHGARGGGRGLSGGPNSPQAGRGVGYNFSESGMTPGSTRGRGRGRDGLNNGPASSDPHSAAPNDRTIPVFGRGRGHGSGRGGPTWGTRLLQSVTA